MEKQRLRTAMIYLQIKTCFVAKQDGRHCHGNCGTVGTLASNDQLGRVGVTGVEDVFVLLQEGLEVNALLLCWDFPRVVGVQVTYSPALQTDVSIRGVFRKAS